MFSLRVCIWLRVRVQAAAAVKAAAAAAKAVREAAKQVAKQARKRLRLLAEGPAGGPRLASEVRACVPATLACMHGTSMRARVHLG